METQKNDKLSPAQIKAILVKYANDDLRMTREKEEIAVCETLRGTIFISYNKETRLYSFQFGNRLDSEIISGLKKSAAVELLTSLYDVVREAA